MAYPEPHSLDDIYGPGAENAATLRDDDEELWPCAQCGRTRPASELEDGACPDCLLERRYIERRLLARRQESNRIIDGQYEISDADPGL